MTTPFSPRCQLPGIEFPRREQKLAQGFLLGVLLENAIGFVNRSGTTSILHRAPLVWCAGQPCAEAKHAPPP